MVMREILLDTLIAYRQEGENVLFIVLPAAILGPVGAIIAGSSFFGALIAVPLLVAIYLAAYCASLRGASFVQSNLAPEPIDSYMELVPHIRHIVALAAKPAALLAVVLAFASITSQLATPWLGLPLAVLGGVAVMLWWARHAYDLPLLIAHELSAADAATAGRELLARYPSWTLTLIALLSAPLAVALLLSWGLALIIAPAFGAAFFAIALACWLPIPAFGLSDVSRRLVDAAVEGRAPANALPT
jgi:hypothetical protein